jgi:replicative DNA helicase
LQGVPLRIEDASSLSLARLRSLARDQRRHEAGLGLVVADYLQLLNGADPRVPREQQVAQFSRELKLLAKELRVPVVALSQLNRMSEQRTDKRPTKADLRESGSIEQDADLVAFIYRDEYYNDESDQQGLAEVILAKHRNGPTDSVKLSFLKRYAKFADLAA